jgi:YegS/Rv2252/BmrU family lipid kinase
MTRKFIYFYNPISGTKNKEALLQLIQEKTTLQNIPYEILETYASKDYSHLPEKVKKDGITDIIICGGDGTVNQVVGSLKDVTVNIGIIPMGSGNGLAMAANLPMSPEKALEIIFDNNPSPVDGFYINNQFSCMLCGLGFDAQVAHDFALQNKRGLRTYVQQTVKNFLSAIHYPFIIQLNEQEIRTEAFFISIANSNQFGNNVTIAPKASISDGLLDIVIVRKMSKLRTLYSLLKQVKMGQINNTTKRYHEKDILYMQTKQLHIDNPKHAPLHIDGDPATTARHFEIIIAEKAFSLLQPLN